MARLKWVNVATTIAEVLEVTGYACSVYCFRAIGKGAGQSDDEVIFYDGDPTASPPPSGFREISRVKHSATEAGYDILSGNGNYVPVVNGVFADMGTLNGDTASAAVLVPDNEDH